MKIIARTTTRYGRTDGAIVELTRDELSIILHGHTSADVDGILTGNSMKLCDRFMHSVRMLERAEAATKLPNVLRTLADMLQIAVPKIEAVIYDEDKQSA